MEKEVQKNEPTDTGEKTIRVITTAPGTFGAGGIVPVGTTADVPLSRVSDNWMRPVNNIEAGKLKKHRQG